jgi:DNA-binding CsgD family transcriptional regulator
MSVLDAKITNQRNLTDAESETVRYLCSGYGVKTVADKRRVSVHTIRRQMESIYHKLKVHNLGALIAMAVALDVVKITLKAVDKACLFCVFLIYLILSQSYGLTSTQERNRLRMPRPAVSRSTRFGSQNSTELPIDDWVPSYQINKINGGFYV